MYRPSPLAQARTTTANHHKILFYLVKAPHIYRLLCVFAPVRPSLFYRLSGCPLINPSCLIRPTWFGSCHFVVEFEPHPDWLFQLTILPSQFAYPHVYFLIALLCRLAAGSPWFCFLYSPLSSKIGLHPHVSIDRSLSGTVHPRATTENQWDSFTKIRRNEDYIIILSQVRWASFLFRFQQPDSTISPE